MHLSCPLHLSSPSLLLTLSQTPAGRNLTDFSSHLEQRRAHNAHLDTDLCKENKKKKKKKLEHLGYGSPGLAKLQAPSAVGQADHFCPTSLLCVRLGRQPGEPVAGQRLLQVRLAAETARPGACQAEISVVVVY